MKKETLKRAVIAAAFTAFMAGTIPGALHATENGASKNDAISKLESCKSSYMAKLRQEALQTKNPLPESMSNGPASAWLQKVSPNEVNMVTNTFEKKEQKEISLDGKKYYANGEGYAFNLSQNPSTRFGVDPLTNKKVDKASAAIYADASGRVFYFESEDSFNGFLALAYPQSVEGSSKAN
ncbi:MAG: hypothetical protein HY954_07325 [Deltaproteobacteria bacterium]|nr:hypothetical protein [Deltaproteobacteria bacterium]